MQQPFTQQLRSPLTLHQLRALQAQDDKCTTLTRMLEHGKLDPVAYSVQEGILYHRVIEGGPLHDPGSHNCAVFVLYTVSIVPSFTSRV